MHRYALLGGWILVLALLGVAVQHNLVVTSDLRAFMPPPRNADQKLLLDQIGEGPASRLLLVNLSAKQGSFEVAARLSHELADALRKDARFTRVLNGEADLAALDPALSGVVLEIEIGLIGSFQIFKRWR